MASTAMLPTLKADDLVLGTLSEGTEIKRGDVIVYSHKLKPGTAKRSFYIFRAVAFSGEVLSIRDGVVSINGEPATYDAPKTIRYQDADMCQTTMRKPAPCTLETIRETLPGGSSHRIVNDVQATSGHLSTYPEISVPEGHIFVLGDNRGNAADSRYARHGTIPLENLRFVARFRQMIFPID